MRLLVTGLSGTLAPHLARAARASGHEVVGWDRAATPPDDHDAGRRFLDAKHVGAIAHLGMGSEDWAGRLAAHAAERGLPFVFTSSAMVFDCLPDGPHAPPDERTARDDYGRYKIRCEDAIVAANTRAMIVRIGWQIDADGDGSAHGNNMLAALDAQQAHNGHIAASRAWTPACSFMSDTAAELLALLQSPRPGVHHVDSNASEAHRFPALVAALAARFDRRDWVIREHADYMHDQRLIGATGAIPTLSQRLALRA